MQPGERCSTDRRGSPPNRIVIVVIGPAVVNRDHPERGRASSPRTRGRSRGMFTESSAVVKCAAWLAEEWVQSGVMPSRTDAGLTRFPCLPTLAPWKTSRSRCPKRPRSGSGSEPPGRIGACRAGWRSWSNRRGAARTPTRSRWRVRSRGGRAGWNGLTAAGRPGKNCMTGPLFVDPAAAARCRRQAELRPLPALGWRSGSDGSCYPACSGQGAIHPMPRQPGKQT